VAARAERIVIASKTDVNAMSTAWGEYVGAIVQIEEKAAAVVVV